MQRSKTGGGGNCHQTRILCQHNLYTLTYHNDSLKPNVPETRSSGNGRRGKSVLLWQPTRTKIWNQISEDAPSWYWFWVPDLGAHSFISPRIKFLQFYKVTLALQIQGQSWCLKSLVPAFQRPIVPPTIKIAGNAEETPDVDVSMMVFLRHAKTDGTWCLLGQALI